ncbi:UNVERIFIED_CONTAM: hypothetical protein HDU68_004015, partial [Siphonaria sp. JEL0065]
MQLHPLATAIMVGAFATSQTPFILPQTTDGQSLLIAGQTVESTDNKQETSTITTAVVSLESINAATGFLTRFDTSVTSVNTIQQTVATTETMNEHSNNGFKPVTASVYISSAVIACLVLVVLVVLGVFAKFNKRPNMLDNTFGLDDQLPTTPFMTNS